MLEDLSEVGDPHGDDVLGGGAQVERAPREHEREAALAFRGGGRDAVPLECLGGRARQHVDDLVERHALLALRLVREVEVAEDALLVADPQPARVALGGGDAAVRVLVEDRAALQPHRCRRWHPLGDEARG